VKMELSKPDLNQAAAELVHESQRIVAETRAKLRKMEEGHKQRERILRDIWVPPIKF